MTWLPAADLNPGQLVELLADPHRRSAAYSALMALGPEASGPAQAGLRHGSAQVREQCCKILDHVMDEASAPALVAALDDPAPQVRRQALHALACDRCKTGSCRPPAALVLPRAVATLETDPDPYVRAMAAEVAGAWVHNEPAAAEALQRAASGDPYPMVRKKASWFAPGGPIYRRTRRGLRTARR
jgi:HEAT repeat protein